MEKDFRSMSFFMCQAPFCGLQIRVNGDVAAVLRFRGNRLGFRFREFREVASRFADLHEDEAGVHDRAVAEGVVVNPVADGARSAFCVPVRH